MRSFISASNLQDVGQSKGPVIRANLYALSGPGYTAAKTFSNHPNPPPPLHPTQKSKWSIDRTSHGKQKLVIYV